MVLRGIATKIATGKPSPGRHAVWFALDTLLSKALLHLLASPSYSYSSGTA
jgi:hypothetical protein